MPSIAAVQAALPSDTCLLEYARIDRGFVCIVVHHDRPPQVRRIADGEHIKTLVSRWGFVACSDPHDQYPAETQQRRQQVLGTLYQALLAPVADLLGPARRLLIAPSDLLSHVPWAALDAGGQPLGANLTISLTPSGAFWAAPFAATQAPARRASLMTAAALVGRVQILAGCISPMISMCCLTGGSIW
ncbi:MAG: CHAT domain-containing protein [Oscillochloris sp.]|nr:CHAT domain-containing protein [Oscillochloris sp.]